MTKRFDPTNGERRVRYIRRLKARAFEIIGKRCIFCGKRKNLHAAHVKPTKLKGPGRGDAKRWKDVIDNPDCYRPMDVNCHRTFDALVSMAKKATWEKEEPIPF